MNIEQQWKINVHLSCVVFVVAKKYSFKWAYVSIQIEEKSKLYVCWWIWHNFFCTFDELYEPKCISTSIRNAILSKNSINQAILLFSKWKHRSLLEFKNAINAFVFFKMPSNALLTLKSPDSSASKRWRLFHIYIDNLQSVCVCFFSSYFCPCLITTISPNGANQSFMNCNL